MNTTKTLLTGALMALAASMSLFAFSGSAQAYGSSYGSSSSYGERAPVVAAEKSLVRKKEIRDGKTYWCEYWKGEPRGCELSNIERRKRFRDDWDFN